MYVIVPVPAVMPATIPLAEPIVALLLLLAQVPPDVPSLSVMPDPVQTEDGPVMPVGNALTVTCCTSLQPDTAYVILAVPPDTPVTIPAVPTVALKLLLLLQVPPAVASVRAVVKPIQTLPAPVIAVIGLMVTVTFLVQPVDSV